LWGVSPRANHNSTGIEDIAAGLLPAVRADCVRREVEGARDHLSLLSARAELNAWVANGDESYRHDGGLSYSGVYRRRAAFWSCAWRFCSNVIFS
jgi:hypothetical protein